MASIITFVGFCSVYWIDRYKSTQLCIVFFRIYLTYFSRRNLIFLKNEESLLLIDANSNMFMLTE